MEENKLIIQRAEELSKQIKDKVANLQSQMLTEENKEITEEWVKQSHNILKDEFNLSAIEILSVDWSEPYNPEVKVSDKPIIQR